MRNRRRNLAILALVLGLLIAAGVVISSKPTKLGLDLKGGVSLVYQARPTPKVPEVTPQAVDDAIETIRKRTDALGVSEPEIQRSGADQIVVDLPDVQNAEQAEDQVGTTAQLQFYDWEPNLIGEEGRPAPEGTPVDDAPVPSLQAAVERAGKAQPVPEEEDIPPGGVEPEIEQRFGGDEAEIRAYYDRLNDSAGGDRLYLFGPDRKPIGQSALTCDELLQEFEDAAPSGKSGAPAGTSECSAELRALAATGKGPPKGSRVLKAPRGVVVVKAERPPDLPPNAPFERYYVLEDDSELSGSDIENPEQNFDQQTQEPIVTFEFTDTGREAFAEVTRRIAQRGSEVILPGGPTDAALQRFAITLDNAIVSLATIDFREYPEGIDGRTGTQINGIGNVDETQTLAENLRIGALPIELRLISKTQVSATLGKQALDQGLLAGGAGLLLTLTFLVLFYRVLGLVAGAALLTYAVLLFALVELIPITLSLPGIAGLILTLGVAADANIVIFERIKEEARSGRSIPAAITSGYAKALRTIVDANVVTIGVAFILFTLATAGVKGFAFTLGIGTIVSLFTAVLATSAILGILGRSRLLRSPMALGARPVKTGRKRFDFMGSSRWFFSMSGLIIALGAIAIAGLGINFGIDFESGTRITAPLEREASVEDVRTAIAPEGLEDAEIQQVTDEALGDNVFQISTGTLPPERVSDVENLLDEEFGVQELSSSSIGPTFGAQIARTALIAIIASLFLISIYIGLRFSFKYAVPVLIALVHDLVITAGVYSLLEREVTTSTVAALLTILGYSLYDTIIVFDRIRENVPRMPRATFSQIVNRSMSEVIVRSLVTSASTLLPVTALMLFGGETLKDFGFALLVGVASGTYSSIFIAAPVLTAWKEREPMWRRRRQIVMEDHDGVIPAYPETALGTDEGEEAVPARSKPTRPRPDQPAPAPAGAARSSTTTAGSSRAAARRAAAKAVAPAPKPDDAGNGRARDDSGNGRAENGGGEADGAADAAEPTAAGTPAGAGKSSRSSSRRTRRKKHGRRT